MAPYQKKEASLVLPAEESAARRRVLKEASNRLVIGPAQAFSAGIAAVFGIGCWEGWFHLQPTSSSTTAASNVTTTERLRFVLRYGLAQIIPSVIWGQQKASTIVAAYGFSPNMIFGQGMLPPRRDMAVNRCISIRGAIAGTVLISQVFSLVDVSNQAKEAYSNNIQAGREPPLMVENPDSNQGVVIRLAGKVSDATLLGMSRDGRRHLFPIFEEANLPEIQHMLREYGVKRGNQHMVPLFWQVNDGQYGHPESWQGMEIPSHWLFDLEQSKPTSTTGEQEDPPTKMLVLEADATISDKRSLSLTLPRHHEEPANHLDLDLDLYEVAQGFYQLQSRVTKEAPKYKVLRVLLADANAVIKYGGGRATTVRDYVTNLGLADIIVDARGPILQALKQWLDERERALLAGLPTKTTRSSASTNAKPVPAQDSSTSFWRKGLLKWVTTDFGTREGIPQQQQSRSIDQKNIIVLETPEESWFDSLRQALERHGYLVCSLPEAMDLCGSLDGIPMLVYERTTQDTIHTIRRLVAKNIVQPENVCAICPSHRGLIECSDEYDHDDANFTEIANICSSDVYDRLLRQVRILALKGYSNEEIQQRLDDNDGTFINCNARTVSDNRRLCVQL